MSKLDFPVLTLKEAEAAVAKAKADRAAWVLEQHDAGVSLSEIGRQLGESRQVVTLWLRKALKEAGR